MPDAPINPVGFLHQDQLEPAAKFVQSLLWADFKRALKARRPSEPEPEDPPHVASARAFQTKAWDKVIEEIEKLPFDGPTAPESIIPRTLIDTKD